VAYDATEWHDLFVAAAGATAALAGLVFVAVSINLERILQYDGLPERGLETVMLLIGVLVVSIVCLIPEQSHLALGLELTGLAVGVGFGLQRLPRIPKGDPGDPRSWALSRWAIRLTGFVLLAIGAISIVLAAGGGLYWIVAGVVFATIGAVANAWVLLVEIMR
jgi:hypothetical protein